MTIDDFVVFIICHEKPENIVTLNTLLRRNFTGHYKIVIDDEDKYFNEYIEKYGGDNICVFNKETVANTIDEMIVNPNRSAIVYARNACFNFAKNLGYKYFIELDEDFTDIRLRYEENTVLHGAVCENVDKIFLAVFEYFEKNPAIKSIALSQGGDFIGGSGSYNWRRQLNRKCMNSFFCSTDRPFSFDGVLNEDVTTYCTYGMRGDLFFTVAKASIEQLPTQSASNGITDLYRGMGTYYKSFFSVMSCPAFVKVSIMGDKYYRIHHKIAWENAVPKIISGRYKEENK